MKSRLGTGKSITFFYSVQKYEERREGPGSSLNILFFYVFDLCMCFTSKLCKIFIDPRLFRAQTTFFIKPVKAWTMLLNRKNFILKN